MIGKLFSFHLLFAAFIITQCAAQNSDQQNIVAKISDRSSISFAELDKYVYDFYYDRIFRKNVAEGYNKALETMIINKSKIIDFFDRVLDEKKELFQSIRRTINEELAAKYYETQFYDKYTNEHAIQKAYSEMGREVVCQQITLSKPKGIPKRRVDSLKALAYEIKAKLDKGKGFDEIKKLYSKKITDSKSSEGMMTIDWNTRFSSALKYTMFNIPKHETRVLQSDEAIHVVQVIAIKVNDVPPFQNVKDKIKNKLKEVYSDLSLQEYDSTKKSLIDEKSLRWNRKGIKQLLQWSNIPDFYQKYYRDTLRHAISQGNNFVVLTYSKGKIDLNEYLHLVDEILTLGKYTSLKEKDLKSYILEAVRTNLIVERASRLNLEKEVVNARTNNPIISSELIRLYNEQVIAAQIPLATQDVLKQFYDENKDSIFYQLAKVNIYAIVDSIKDTVENLKRALQQNVPYEKLRNVLLVKTFIKDRKGYIKSFQSPEKPYLGDAAFKLSLHETAGPIEYYDSTNVKQYALIKCIGWQEEKQLLFQDVKYTIEGTYKRYQLEKITQATHELLRKKYPITIYKDVLNKNLISLGIKLK